MIFIKEIKIRFLFILEVEKMEYGYGRCSTNELKQDIDRQIRELQKRIE